MERRAVFWGTAQARRNGRPLKSRRSSGVPKCHRLRETPSRRISRQGPACVRRALLKLSLTPWRSAPHRCTGCHSRRRRPPAAAARQAQAQSVARQVEARSALLLRSQRWRETAAQGQQRGAADLTLRLRMAAAPAAALCLSDSHPRACTFGRSRPFRDSTHCKLGRTKSEF